MTLYKGIYYTSKKTPEGYRWDIRDIHGNSIQNSVESDDADERYFETKREADNSAKDEIDNWDD